MLRFLYERFFFFFLLFKVKRKYKLLRTNYCSLKAHVGEQDKKRSQMVKPTHPDTQT